MYRYRFGGAAGTPSAPGAPVDSSPVDILVFSTPEFTIVAIELHFFFCFPRVTFSARSLNRTAAGDAILEIWHEGSGIAR